MTFPEERKGLRAERRSFDAERTSPRRYTPPIPVESAIAISINLGTGCKGRREIVFPCKDVRERRERKKGRIKKGLDIPGSSLRFPGAELFRRVAARIKASCGIKNLCNQLSNLLPHISRPMSRHPRRRL